MGSKFTSELKEGMITLTDTYSTKGKLILPKNTVITKSIISKLVSNDVLFVEIEDEAVELKSDDISFQNFAGLLHWYTQQANIPQPCRPTSCGTAG